MIIIVNCQACGKQLFRDQDYEPKGHGVQLLVQPCDCAAEHRVHTDLAVCTCGSTTRHKLITACSECGLPISPIG